MIGSLFVAAMTAGAAEVCETALAETFTDSTDVFAAEIVATRAHGGRVFYAATLNRPAKGCLVEGQTVLLEGLEETSPSMAVGQNYLIPAIDAGPYMGTRKLSVDACDTGLLVSDLTVEDRTFLRANQEDCVCEDLTDADYGPCLMLLGYGLRDGACASIGGCYRPEDPMLFPTLEACESACE